MGVVTATIVFVGIALAGFFNFVSSNASANEFLIFELGSIIIMAAIFALFARLLKQPPILAYVLSGFIIGPAVLAVVKDVEIINSFSEIGIAFLLFIAGLELSFKKLKQINLKKILIITTLQVLLVFFLTLFSAKYIGLNQMQAIYIGVAIAFSSTMIVVKILSDKKELITMHGRLVLGILLLQDLFAIIAIVLLTSSDFSLTLIGMSVLKLMAIVLIAFLLQRYALSGLFKRAAESSHSKELLLLGSLAVLFTFILISIGFEFSIVIGAFIAGVSLANLPFRVELEARVGPLRDFFSILFFVALGMQITIAGVGDHLSLFIFLLIGAFIIKPLVTLAAIRFSGYRGRTSFISALSLAQLSEFSIIVAVLGFNLGFLTQSMLSTIIITTIVTMSLTIFFIDYENFFFRIFKRPLSLFNFLPIKENVGYSDKEKKSILLVGCDRMGSIVLRELTKESKKEILVLDYNPEIIAALRNKKISCVYGDVKSPDMLENFDLKNLKKVISTVPDIDDGLVILEKIKKHNKDIVVILTAHSLDDALELYHHGADYVMVPRFTAGEVVSNILKKDGSSLESIKKNQIERLKSANNILK